MYYFQCSAHGYGEDYWPPASVHRPPGLVPRRPPRPGMVAATVEFVWHYFDTRIRIMWLDSYTVVVVVCVV